MNLSQKVQNRQSFGDGDRFTKAVVNNRIGSMELSKQIEVSKDFTGSIFSMDLDPSEQKYLLCGSSDGSISIVDVDPCTNSPKTFCPVISTIHRGSKHCHKHMVVCSQWYPHDSGMFTTSSTDQTLKVWDTNRMKPVETYSFAKSLSNHHWSWTKQSLIAIAAGINAVLLVDLRSGSALQQFKGHRDVVNVVRWSPRSPNMLISGGYDGQLLVWDVRSAKSALASLRPASIKRSKKLNSETFTARAHTGVVNGLRFTPDGLLLFSLGTEGVMRMWDTKRLVDKKNSYEFSSTVSFPRKLVYFDLAYDGTEMTLFVPAEDDVEMIKPFLGRKTSTTLHGHYNPVNTALYRSNFNQLYTSANDKTVLCWVPKMDQNKLFIEENAGGSENVHKLTEDAWSDDDDL